MAAPPPKDSSGLTPEMIAYSNGSVLLAQTAPIFAVAALVVLGRCYTRAFIVRSFRTDDWTMLIAILFATVCFVCYSIQISMGVGKYLAVIQADEEGYRQLPRVRQIHMICVVVGLSMGKISICFFLLRLATRRTYTWFLWGMIGFIAAFTLACTGTLVFQCVPVAAAWDVRLRPPPLGTGNAKCFSDRTFTSIWLFNGVVNILTDFLLAFLPVPLIWKLQMPLRTRLSLVVILSLGIFAAAAGIIRQQSTSQFLEPEPWIHDVYAIWNFIELDMGIIAASLPALKPMFSWFSNAARIMTKAVNTAASRSRTAEGYHKHTQPPNDNSFTLADYGPGGEVRMSSHLKELSNKWDSDRDKSSEESILPRDQAERKLGGIMITKSVQVG